MRWTDDELQACVDLYLYIRAEQQAGRSVNKTELYKQIAEDTVHRGYKAVERRMQNISSVMQDDLGLPFVEGLKPAGNVGKNVRPKIRSMLEDGLGPEVPPQPPPSSDRLRRMMRLCWNSEGWRNPTGEASELETGSYVAQHGFGHEEWLFDWSRLLQRGDTLYRYGFLQPLGSALTKLEGKTMDLLLYTRTPSGTIEVVGTIYGAQCLTPGERRWALEQYKDRGWLEEMKAEVRRADPDADLDEFDEPVPEAVVNVRFTQDQVRILDPRREILDKEHKAVRMHRYVAMEWDGEYPNPPSSRTGRRGGRSPDETRDSTQRRQVEATTIQLRHAKMQRLLFESLEAQHGPGRVVAEENHVDLTLRMGERTRFYELKTANTARACIREALGQLLEYAHYGSPRLADEFWIVGDCRVTAGDQRYLAELRDTYKLPVWYGRFDWATGQLVETT